MPVHKIQRSQEIYTKGLKAKRFKNIISTAENGSVITIAGNGTKVQNGGKIAPPTTFK